MSSWCQFDVILRQLNLGEEEGVAELHFVESTEANLIVSATPPIKYVNKTINDIVEDVIIVREELKNL